MNHSRMHFPTGFLNFILHHCREDGDTNTEPQRPAPGRNKRLFFARHAKSSAVIASLFFHAVFLVLSLSIVVMSFHIKQDPSFIPLEAIQAHIELKKRIISVEMERKRTKNPKLPQLILAEEALKPLDINIPDMPGIQLGTDYLYDGGLGGLGALLRPAAVAKQGGNSASMNGFVYSGIGRGTDVLGTTEYVYSIQFTIVEDKVEGSLQFMEGRGNRETHNLQHGFCHGNTIKFTVYDGDFEFNFSLLREGFRLRGGVVELDDGLSGLTEVTFTQEKKKSLNQGATDTRPENADISTGGHLDASSRGYEGGNSASMKGSVYSGRGRGTDVLGTTEYMYSIQFTIVEDKVEGSLQFMEGRDNQETHKLQHGFCHGNTIKFTVYDGDFEFNFSLLREGFRLRGGVVELDGDGLSGLTEVTFTQEEKKSLSQGATDTRPENTDIGTGGYLDTSSRGYEVGVVTGPIEAASDAHYYYYVPMSLKPGRQAPLLFYTHWNGAKVRLLQEIIKGAEICQWILAISVESRNGRDEDANVQCAEEAVEHILKTLPVKENRFYFTGNSGGAAMAFLNYYNLDGCGIMPCAGYIPNEASTPRCDCFIINGAMDYNRYSSAVARRDIGKSAVHRFYEGGHSSRPSAWLKIEGMVWLEGRYLSRKGRRYPEVQKDYENAVLEWINELRVDEPHRAYYWALFLQEELDISKSNALRVENIIKVLGADNRNQLYVEGLEEIDIFSLKVLSGYDAYSQYGHSDPLLNSKCESMLKKYKDVPVIADILKALRKPTNNPHL